MCSILLVVATYNHARNQISSVDLTLSGGSYKRNVCEVGPVLLVCFGLMYAWYDMETVVGLWHVETGETLSAKHVCPVGGVAYEARC
jgi:hypothetical protein